MGYREFDRWIGVYNTLLRGPEPDPETWRDDDRSWADEARAKARGVPVGQA